MTTEPGYPYCRRRWPPFPPSPVLGSSCPCSQGAALAKHSARLLGTAVLLLAALATDPSGALAAPTYAGRVASASASAASTGVTLTAGRQVAAGDAILIALRLTGTVSGGVGATDDAGNSYRVDVDQDDGLSLGRLVVLSATNAASLGAGGTIRVTFPLSTGYQVS